MKWAIAQGYRTDNPAGDVLAEALSKRPVRVRHMAARHCQVEAFRTDPTPRYWQRRALSPSCAKTQPF